MKKTKALATLIIGGLLVLVQLPAMGSLVIPTNAHAVGYDLTTLGLFQTVVFADDPVSADSTLAPLLGLQPHRVFHIREAGRFIGNIDDSVISHLT